MPLDEKQKALSAAYEAKLKKEAAHKKALADAEAEKRSAEEARRNEEFKLKQAEREAAAARAEKVYWAQIETKNDAARRKHARPLTLDDVLGTVSQKGAFTPPRVKARQAKAEKTRMLRLRREAALERSKGERLAEQRATLVAGGASWQARQALELEAKNADAAQAALMKRMREKEAKEAEKIRARERQRVADAAAKEAAAAAKREKMAHYLELEAKTHWHASKCKYFGDYADSPSKTVRSGFGEFTWSSGGRVYEGEYAGGRMAGVGVYEWANGDTWEGQFKDDELHGLGKFTHVEEGHHDRGSSRWCFYCAGRRVCWRDEMQCGGRVAIVNGRTGRRHKAALVRAATEAPGTKQWAKGTWLVKFDEGGEAQWRDLADLTWELLRHEPVTVTMSLPHVSAHIIGYRAEDRAAYPAHDAWCSIPKSVDDEISMATNRPLMKHVPLIRAYYL
jgi:hypothetical protein